MFRVSESELSEKSIEMLERMKRQLDINED